MNGELEPQQARDFTQARDQLPVSGSVRKLLGEAAAIVLIGGLLGAASNIVRGNARIKWVEDKPYDVLVPCSEPVGDAQVIQPDSPRVIDTATLLIDTRSQSEFGQWHAAGAVNVPFDWLGPPVQDDIKRVAQMVTRSKAKQVVVCGDGDDPDSGREWARLLAGGGIRNVYFVQGGAPALKDALQQKGAPKP